MLEKKFIFQFVMFEQVLFHMWVAEENSKLLENLGKLRCECNSFCSVTQLLGKCRPTCCR